MSQYVNIVFRAKFQGPKGEMNLGGFAAPLLMVDVEVFCSSSRSPVKWCVRGPGQKQPWKQYPWQPTADVACSQVGKYFAKQAEPWQLFEIPPIGPAVKVNDGEVYQDDKNGLYYRYSKENKGLPGAGVPKAVAK